MYLNHANKLLQGLTGSKLRPAFLGDLALLVLFHIKVQLGGNHPGFKINCSKIVSANMVYQ